MRFSLYFWHIQRESTSPRAHLSRTRHLTSMAPKSKKHARSPSADENLSHPSTKRAKEIDTTDNPYNHLLKAIKSQKQDPKPQTILHWFRPRDLRIQDNAALSAASAAAKNASVPLLAAFLFSPKDLEWHGTSAARTDFMLEGLKIMQDELEKLHIPLVPLIADARGEKGTKIVEFIKKHDISHVFANFEYEIDELRRDLDLYKRLADQDVKFQLFHDQTAMEPAKLTGGGGTPIKVFTPYHKAWLIRVGKEPKLFKPHDDPLPNDISISTKHKDLFGLEIPKPPESKQFESEADRKSIRKLWPAGHQAALDRLNNFLKKKIKTYHAQRSTPATDNSSRLSAYFSSGMLSIREALTLAYTANQSVNFDTAGDPGIYSWVRELVFREFYRHMLVLVPHNAMNLPKNLRFTFVNWERDEEGWRKWCTGHTGMPFIDAGMRQLNAEAYMHNRLRMNTASYLRTNLLIDYRRGERYFAEHLIDWDLANNTNGWEPSYTVFNPVVQAEKCDPDGAYIRRWVPELKGVLGKAVFDPFARLTKAEFEKLGYPAPHVDFKESRQRCLDRYKSDMAGVEP